MDVRLKKEEKVKVANSRALYKIMKNMLQRDNLVGRKREHFWVASFNSSNVIINVELVALGSADRTEIRPADIFSIAFQKRADYIVLVHNHPSGNAAPSNEDLDLTDQMLQIGRYHRCPVYDHLVITETKYYSMRDKGDIQRLEKFTKYAVNQIEDMARVVRREKEIRKERDREVARNMRNAGVKSRIISAATGLSEEEVKGLDN